MVDATTSDAASVPSGETVETRTSVPTRSTASYIMLVASLTMLTQLRRKKMIFFFIVTAVCTFIFCVAKAEGASLENGWLLIAPQAYVMVLAPIVCLFMGTAAVTDDYDNGTFGYLLTRPAPRTSIYAGKFIASWLVATGLVSMMALAGYLPSVYEGSIETLFPPLLWHEFLALIGVIALASAVYVSLYMLFALRLKRPVLSGIFHVLVAEMALSSVPGPPSSIAVSFYSRELLHDPYLSTGRLAHEGLGIPINATPPTILIGFVAALGALIGLGLWSMKTAEFASTQTEDET